MTGMIDIGADESHRINRVMLILSNLCVELVLASSSSVSIGNNSYNIGSLKPDSSHTIVSSSSPSAAPSPPSTDLTPTNVAAIQAYVRSFSKYHVVSLILVMSLSDIDMNVQSGAWEQVLNKNEQGRLVRALFTDSPKREGVMKRINGF